MPGWDNVSMEFRVEDVGTNPASIHLPCKVDPASLDPSADLQLVATALTPLLDACLDGQLTYVNLSLPATLGAAKGAPNAGSTITRGANLRFEAGGISQQYSLLLACALPSIFGGTNDTDVQVAVDPTLALVNYLIAAHDNVTFTDKLGNNLSAIFRGKLATRKDRRTLRALHRGTR